MESDRIRWNEKYGDKTYSDTPSEILTRFYTLAPPGRALDIATGMGRNALFMAEKGFAVDAVDISDVAVKALGGRHRNLTALRRDLDTHDIPAGRYSLIVNVRYLNRRLFPQIVEALVPGGLLVFETYIQSPEDGDGPRCRDYLLRENELLHAFLSLQVVYYEERKDTGPKGPFETALLVARQVR